MTTKSSRHAMIEVSCVWCGNSFMARKQRVEQGLGKFCSRKCCNDWQRENAKSDRVGKENAKAYFDKARGGYVVQWRDENTNEVLHSTWARWAWEVSFGDVPDGHVVSYKDGNPENIVIENLYLKTPEEIAQETSDRMLGKVVSDETKEKLSKAHSGKTLSKDHKNNIGNASRKMWSQGIFDEVHVGKYHRLYKGGTKPYPDEFTKDLRFFVKSRDNHTCQICGRNVYRSRHGHVHHIDGNKQNNDLDNLITLCASCHIRIHKDEKNTSPVIMAFKSKLLE